MPATLISREQKKNEQRLIVDIVHRISHYLPIQGPIEVFVHHNTLHPYESMNFLDGVESAARLYHAQPYMSESYFQEKYAKGDISYDDLYSELDHYEGDGEVFFGDVTVRELRIESMLVSQPPDKLETVWWQLIENDEFTALYNKDLPSESLRSAADADKLWLSSTEGTADVDLVSTELLKELVRSRQRVKHELGNLKAYRRLSPFQQRSRVLWLVCLALISKNRDLLRTEQQPTDSNGCEDPRLESLVSTFLVKFSGAFLDQGISRWALTHREEGFFRSLLHHLSHPSVFSPWWLRDLDEQEVERLLHTQPEEFIREELRHMSVPQESWERFLLQELLTVKGWAGMMHVFQKKPDLAPLDTRSHHETLLEFVAAKLLLEREARKCLSYREGWDNRTYTLSIEDSIHHLAYQLFRVLFKRGIPSEVVRSLSIDSSRRLVSALLHDSKVTRQRTWQKALENRFLSKTASALKSHSVRLKATEQPSSSNYQVIFCIDDREESLRRYLEETCVEAETFGTAGFFAIDAEYQPHGGRSAPLCPVSIVPTHRVIEKRAESKHDRLLSVIWRFQRLSVQGSQRALYGWLVSLMGSLSVFPLLIKTISPRTLHTLKGCLESQLSDGDSLLEYELRADSDQNEEDAEAVSSSLKLTGFSVSEMADRVESLLRSIGLTKSFAPLILLLGHGSLSRNNPYKSAYDCGACGGRPAKMNGRAFALMANRADVRVILKSRGLEIPEKTLFVGGFHNTCDDSIELSDLRGVPDTHKSSLRRLLDALEKARGLNAWERCRRFTGSHPRSPQEALALVEERTLHIAEPRPEYGHATNALCIVGPRRSTRGLFLDRRAFLVSYEPADDPAGNILSEVLQAVTPVCMGINLEYFFSAVDNEVYGAGTKLPHNITSMLGIMSGYSSDLRTGLPKQMVEIHTPMRLVFLIESNRAQIDGILERNEKLAQLFRNEWVIPCVFERADNRIFRLNGHEWAEIGKRETLVPHVASSREWVRDSADDLPFASIGSMEAFQGVEQ